MRLANRAGARIIPGVQAAADKAKRRDLRLGVRVPLALLFFGLLAGCRERGGEIELPPLPPLSDGGPAAPALPDGAVLCSSDEDCDDGIDCSRDLCAPGGYCINVGDNSRCDDGVFCNGQEVCEPATGCRPGSPRRCNDENACTLDLCDEANKQCVHAPRDVDGDGEVDWHCPGGTDCDDFDAMRGSSLPEICGDGIDNDCDGVVDEQDCIRPRFDRCEDALDISGGGRFEIDLRGAAPNYLLGCSKLGPRDVAMTFTIDEPHDVWFTAIGLLRDNGTDTAAVALRSNCSDFATELECSYGFPGQVRIRALPKGRYFLLANSEHAERLIVDARFTDPTPAPANTSCEAPLDISAGGRFTGDFVDVGDDFELACGFAGANDLSYVFTIEEERDVEVSALSLSGGERMSLAVRTTCDDAASTLRCVSSVPARARLHQLPAGTYYVVIEGSNAREVDFSLDVAFLDPTPPPPGDACADPLALELAAKRTGSLANRQDLIAVDECNCDLERPGQCTTFLPEVVYRVRVDEPSDLGFTFSADVGGVAYAFRSVCDSASAQRACGTGATINARIRDLSPGDYYLIVESAEPASIEFELKPLPRTIPVPVGGNDTCATAIEIPASGGLFSGDTLGFGNHYQARCGNGAQSSDAAFRLTLPSRSRVTATLEAAFDTVLYRYRDDGSGPRICNGLSSDCSDDGVQGNRNSRLDETLEAGTYYYIVDGFGGNNQGRYLFEVVVASP
jgi:hypothetical protein